MMADPGGDFDELVDGAKHALTNDRMLLVLNPGCMWHVLRPLASDGVRQPHQPDIMDQGGNLHLTKDFWRDACPLTEPTRQASHLAAAIRMLWQASLQETNQQPHRIQQSALK